jgi:hypothetical protein
VKKPSEDVAQKAQAVINQVQEWQQIHESQVNHTQTSQHSQVDSRTLLATVSLVLTTAGMASSMHLMCPSSNGYKHPYLLSIAGKMLPCQT